jgi:hypothetical protein
MPYLHLDLAQTYSSRRIGNLPVACAISTRYHRLFTPTVTTHETRNHYHADRQG